MAPGRPAVPRRLVSLLVTLVMAGCWGGVPDTVGGRNGNLAPCPATPNCVHTGLRHPDGTEAMFQGEGVYRRDVIPGIRAVIEAMPRTVVVTERPDYLHAEFRSRVFHFVDDLEVLVMPDGEIVVRSASRIGSGDLGVNAERVATLRAALVEAGIVR